MRALVLCSIILAAPLGSTGSGSAAESANIWPSWVCAATFAQAGDDVATVSGLERLDVAVRSCASPEDFLAAAELDGRALLDADPETLLASRCSDPLVGLGTFASCYHLRDSLPQAMASISVSPSGRGPATSDGPGQAVAIILDTSGSMLRRLDGVRRIDIAKESLATLVQDSVLQDIPMVLRIFGGEGSGKAIRCATRLAAPLAPLDQGDTLERVREVKARKLTGSPIAASLFAVADDLSDTEGRRVIIMVTDGDESCGGDLHATIEDLQESGLEFRLDVVGFALDDEDLKRRMAGWALAGGGRYFDATKADELVTAMSDAIATSIEVGAGSPFVVTAADGSLVGSGIVGGASVDVAPGEYRVEVNAATPVAFEDVVVGLGSQVQLDLP